MVAPIYFPPETIQWHPQDPARHFLLVDVGSTSFNGSAFTQYRMATDPLYRLGWASGESQLLVVWLGTGMGPVSGVTAEDPGQNVLSDVKTTLKSLMTLALFEQDLGRALVYACDDALVDQPGLQALGVAQLDADRAGSMDCVDAIPDVKAVGQQVSHDHFGAFANPAALPLAPRL